MAATTAMVASALIGCTSLQAKVYATSVDIANSKLTIFSEDDEPQDLAGQPWPSYPARDLLNTQAYRVFPAVSSPDLREWLTVGDSHNVAGTWYRYFMIRPLSASTMLATSMQAQPGVYAVLLGSGVSTGAGVPTGWGVVKELVRRVAVADTPDDEESLRAAEKDPEAWWQARYAQPLGYSSLLESLTPTPATRQGILAGFFEPTDENREDGVKTPSKDHLALAQLVKHSR